MAILSIARDWGVDPSIVRITSSDTLSQVDAAGYITAQDANIQAINAGAFEWQLSDMVLVYASDGWGFFTISSDFTSLDAFAFSTTLVNGPAVVGDFASFASVGGNIEDLGYLPSNPAYTNVVMANTPTVSGVLAMFNDVNGSVTDSAYSQSASLLVAPAVSSLTAHSGGGQASALALTKEINNVTTVAAAGDSVKLPTSVAGYEITITNSGANSMQVYGAGTDTINGVTSSVGVAQLPGQTVVYSCAAAGNWLANVQGNPNQILFASVPISAAEFNGMYAAPKALIAAPGANKLIVVEAMELIMTYVSADYAAGGVVAAQYDNTVHGAGVLATNSEAAADFAASASTTFQFVGASGDTAGALPFSTTVNKGLYLSNATGAFTTGDSTWVAKIYYRIVNTVGAL